MRSCGSKDTLPVIAWAGFFTPTDLNRFLLFMGVIFSGAAMVYCRFVDAAIEEIVGDLPKPLSETLETYLPTDDRRGLRFFFCVQDPKRLRTEPFLA
jgi:hypothetical protein